MPKTSARKTPKKYLPPLKVPLTFDQLVTGILQVDPKKLPGKGKLTTAAAKKKKGKSNRDNQAR